MNIKGVTSTESSCGVGRAEKAKIPSATVVAAPIRSKLCVRRRRLRSSRLLTHTYARSLKFFEYELMRVMGNEQVVDYLYNIHHFSARQGRPSPFEHLIDYGIKVGLVNKKHFLDPTSYRRDNRLHKYLNF